jgi:peptidoglycan hydrolase-like protein with peptidoglycan-binding domain
MPPQPVVTEPASGFWTVEQIYPTLPFAAYSPAGKKYLLYRTQATLKERKLYTSTVDGKEGKGTHNAIQVFQAKSGLHPTGLLDVPTLAALQLNAEPDNSQWLPPSDTSSSGGPRRGAPGGGRYGRQSEEGPTFLERTGGKIKDLFK